MNKKLFIITAITFILVIIMIAFTLLSFNKLILKNNFENSFIPFSTMNEKEIFKIEKIILFSSSDSKNKTSSANHFTIQNLFQYTDIAIFLSSVEEEKTFENTLKKVEIKNIRYNTEPEVGIPNLYFKGFNQFAKSELNEDNLIPDYLEFIITSEETADLNTPILYNNLANPITLSYINSNIKSDYTITNTNIPITYDGSLLKRCNVSLESIGCNLSFDIYITNNLNQEFKSTIHIDIPLSTHDKSIYDGNITLNNNTNYIFYRFN